MTAVGAMPRQVHPDHEIRASGEDLRIRQVGPRLERLCD